METEVSGASRTDAGVHALCNLAVFDTESRIPSEKFANALNVRLPEAICVQSAREVPADFHPRFARTVKTYDYVIYNARFPSPRRRRFTYYSYTPFDVARMKEAAQYLVGEHDFKSFCSVHTQALTTTREITAIEVFERPCEEERAAELVDEGVSFENYESACESADNPDVENPDANRAQCEEALRPAQRRGVSPREIVIRVSGTGFLYNMVRIIAGTLMEAGRGAIEPEQVKSILEACDRSKAGPTAPPEGLTLVRYRILKKSSQKLQKNEETN